MLTGAELTVGTTVLKGAWAGLGKLRGLMKDKRDAPILEAIGEIQTQLLDAQTAHGQLLSAYEEIARQHAGLLEAVRASREDFEFRDSVLWRKADNAGPFCSRCMDVERRPVRMMTDDRWHWSCPDCKNVVNTPALIKEHASSRSSRSDPYDNM